MELSLKIKKLFDGKNFANVAELMPDGSPQVATVWIDRNGDTIVLNAANAGNAPRISQDIRGLHSLPSTRIIRTLAHQSEERLSRLRKEVQKGTSIK
jgi:hypothetical protein